MSAQSETTAGFTRMLTLDGCLSAIRSWDTVPHPVTFEKVSKTFKNDMTY